MTADADATAEDTDQAQDLTVDGRRVHIRTGGVTVEPDAPTVVLVHGAGMDGTVWSQQTRYLSMRRVRALAVDLPGHGQSQGPALSTVPAMGTWLAQLLQQLGGPVVLAGHSMGTYVALEAASAHPELVNSLVLLGTASNMPVHPDLLEAAQHDLPRAASLMTGWSHAPGSRIGDNPTPGLWMTGGVEALVERSGPGVLLTDLEACARFTGADELAGLISCPVAVVIGAHDKMTPPPAARALAAKMVNATSVDLVELPDAGHMTLTEEPRAVRKTVLAAALAAHSS
ncbi:MAG: alpha/beta hydrolase [Acidimicrobiales bacterium]|nr:alpha/beta hydrolase [Acidimicrobiales bacterium]